MYERSELILQAFGDLSRREIKMFNSYSSSKTNININAVSGTIVKNHKDSFILDYHLDSTLGRRLMTANPTLERKIEYYNSTQPVVILQSMVCGDLRVISEIMWKSDFDALFDKSEEGR
jgi:hypothetical protein